MLNTNTIKKLIELNKGDQEIIELISSCLDSFEQYHRAVFADQLFLIIYGDGVLDGDDYRERRSSVDYTRTIYHNSVISNVGILNRLAANAGLEPVYDGVVSKERPYRRQLANAVFEYIESIINNRS